jgi:hypothetical protein
MIGISKYRRSKLGETHASRSTCRTRITCARTRLREVKALSVGALQNEKSGWQAHTEATRETTNRVWHAAAEARCLAGRAHTRAGLGPEGLALNGAL